MLVCLTFLLAMSSLAMADDVKPLFSGPQVSEALTPFEAQPAFGEAEKIAVLDGAMDSPVLLVFVHQVTRPSIGLTRLLMDYAATKESQGLQSRLVFLTDDPTDTKALLQRARRALPQGVQPSISTEGIEGPGAYGLNRNMSLTVLIASDGVVTANFPLVQPSIQADGPKIGHEIVKVLGGDQMPTLKEMGFEEKLMRRARPDMARGQQTPERDAIYRQYMAAVIQKSATPEEVAVAAKAVEDFATTTPWFKQRVQEASARIAASPRLSDYGTVEAQEKIKKWATQFAAGDRAAKEPQSDSAATDESTSSSAGGDE